MMIAILWILVAIAQIAFFIWASIRLFKWAEDKACSDFGILFSLAATIHAGLGLLMHAFFWAFLVMATTGLGPNYSHGEVDGYLYDVKFGGVHWRTTEGTLLVGEHKRDTLRWMFSSGRKPKLGMKIMSLRGNRVRLTYRRWWLQPYWVGDTSDEVISIEQISGEDG